MHIGGCLRMKPALALVVMLLIGIQPSIGQAVKVREQAEHLLERANAVSSSPHLPDLERIDTFRVLVDGEEKEGSFTRVVVQGTGRRDEYTYGDYHLLNIWTENRSPLRVAHIFCHPNWSMYCALRPSGLCVLIAKTSST